jgi:hypothetical protein
MSPLCVLPLLWRAVQIYILDGERRNCKTAREVLHEETQKEMRVRTISDMRDSPGHFALFLF